MESVFSSTLLRVLSVSSRSWLQVILLNIHVSGKSVKSVFSTILFKSFAVYEFHQQSMLNAFLFLSKNFSPHTEKMDFTDFVEPCSFEFKLFHTFSVFVLDNWFLQIFRRHEASVELRFHLEHYKNYFIEIANIFQSQKAKGSRLKPRKRTVV